MLKRLPAFFDAKGLAITQHEAISKDGTRSPVLPGRARGPRARRQEPDAALRLRRIRDLDGPAVQRHRRRGAGSRRAASTWSPTSAAAASSGRSGTRPRSRRTATRPTRTSSRSPRTSCAARSPRRAHLGIQGGSNGGLLMGNMLTLRPELFGAIVCQVPLLDMRRYHKLLAGASWMAEYGDPDDPEEWAFIRTSRPTTTLRPGVTYPPTLFTTSTRDDRVHPATRARWWRRCGRWATTSSTTRTSKAATAARRTTPARAHGRARLHVPLAEAAVSAAIHTQVTATTASSGSIRTDAHPK